MTEKKSNSTQEKNSVKERMFYFLIIYPVNENDKSNISFNSPKDKPECIYMEQKNRNQNEKPVNIMIFKYKLKGKKNTINIKYSLKNETFEILFDVKESSFIFDLVLRKKVGASSKSKVKQDVIDYYEKMTYFIKALEKKNENEKFEILFLDAVNLYSQKPSFDFLIRLFIKFYDDKNFELCSKLLDKFSKLINNENNMKRNPNLKEFIGFFKI